MYKLAFYVPESHLDAVKNAVFAAQAGRIGHYEHCCWQVLGQGQFQPLDAAKPFIGTPGILETLSEYRVELVCDDAHIKAAVAALKATHPYEEPAYEVYKLETM